MRAAANARERRVEATHTHVERCAHVRQREPARVVKVRTRELVADRVKRLLVQASNLCWIGVAYSVCEADTVRAGIKRGLQQPQHFVLRNFALNRAAERRAHAHLDPDFRACCIACRADLRNRCDHFVGRLANVGSTVRSARRNWHQQRVRIDFDGSLGPLQVWHQHRRFKSRQRLRVRDQFCGVSELRQQPHRHKRTDLDLALPSRISRRNPFKLLCGGKNRCDALQAIAQTHFADGDGCFHNALSNEFNVGAASAALSSALLLASARLMPRLQLATRAVILDLPYLA